MSDLAEPLGPGDHVRGPRDAPLIVEYGDYQCPYSRAAYRHVQRLEHRLDGRLRFCFRNFPLEAKHPLAWGAALAAEAGARQGRFWVLHDLLFRHQDALAPPDLRRHAAAAGLDLIRFDADLAAGAGAEAIRAHLAGGRASGVTGIPVLFVDGERHRGGRDERELLGAIARHATT